MLLLAMDRAPTVRSFDADGRLHVAVSNISKANVCPYAGREIPGWMELGLEPDRIYKLLRCPLELAAALPTFNNLPVLSEHIPVTSLAEDSHMPDLVVGSTGTDAAIDGPYLTNSLVVWAKPSIDGIVNDEKRQLSSAYRYRADMTPGNYLGIAYDGVMRDIVGNHVALVFEGRAGADVVVGDEQPMAFKSKRALMLAGGLSGLIRPLLAQDAKFDLGPVLSGVTAKSLGKTGATKKLAEQVFGLAQPLLAADAALDLNSVQMAVDAVADTPLAEDDDLPDPAEDADGDDDDDKGGTAEDADGDDDDKPAMDENAVKKLVEKARKDALAESAAIRTAEREVHPVVGEIVAMDSAADVYKVGLEALGVDVTKLAPGSYGETFRAVKAARETAAPIAMDSRAVTTSRTDFDTRFPNRTKLIRG